MGSCGWAWGGKFTDLDNDGRLDLVVTNGFISADRKRNYWYEIEVLEGASRKILADARIDQRQGAATATSDLSRRIRDRR